MKKYIVTLVFLGFVFTTFAQETVVKGKMIDHLSNQAIPETNINILGSNITSITDGEGYFEISGENLPLGEQILMVEKAGYVVKRFPIVINSGETLDLGTILMEIDFNSIQSQIGIIALTEEEL